MLTRSNSNQSNRVTILSRATRTPYYLRNLPRINYLEPDYDDEVSNEEDDILDIIEINYDYNNDDMPGPYDDFDYDYNEYGCGSYDGYDGYDN